MKVSWSRWATNQWLESFEYLQRENPSAAARIGAGVVAAHPHAGRVGRIAGTREFAVPRSPFVIAYGVNRLEGILWVFAVYDGRRRWPKDFARE
jgi:toxin ParE1/3/4